MNLNDILKGLNIPGFDNSNVVHAAVAVVVFGIIILALTFLLPLLGEIIVVLGLLAIAYVVFRFFQMQPRQ